MKCIQCNNELTQGGTYITSRGTVIFFKCENCSFDNVVIKPNKGYTYNIQFTPNEDNTNDYK